MKAPSTVISRMLVRSRRPLDHCKRYVVPSLPAAVNVNDEAVESAVMMPLRIKCASASSSEATGVPAGATTEVGVAESAWQNVVTSSNERNTSGPPHPSSGVSFVTSTSSSRMATLQTVPSRSRKRDAQQRRLAAPLTCSASPACATPVASTAKETGSGR